MKKFIFFMTICFVLTLVSNIFRELQDMLAAELVSSKAFQVLERKEIDAVLGEQDLGESGRIDNKTKAK